MAVVIEGHYLGKKKTRLVHGPSGAVLLTDAPRDNAGEGSAFSPTDMVAAALGACMMTIIGIFADHAGLGLAGMRMRVEKEMRGEPRRIGTLNLVLHLPEALEARDREKLERAARACPVWQSLHPEIAITTQFVYDVPAGETAEQAAGTPA